tara:strand:+ start:1309 stop:1962 length:654 start_codon:yes stop_codon:yes gene_type:complete
MEVWKEIEGFEGAYEVSNLGNFKSRRRRRGSRLSPGGPKSVFYRDSTAKVALTDKNGRQRAHWAALLVARAFAGPWVMSIRHKDGDKSNLAFENLECLREAPGRRSKITKAQAREIQWRYDEEERVVDIAKDFPMLSYQAVASICRRDTWDDGRDPRGVKKEEKPKKVKLPEEEVKLMRYLHDKGGMTIREIAKRHPNMSRQAVGNIVKGRTYQWVK